MRRRHRLGDGQRGSVWPTFLVGVVSSVVGGLIVYLLVKDSRVT
jgi:hypothetical protein